MIDLRWATDTSQHTLSRILHSFEIAKKSLSRRSETTGSSSRRRLSPVHFHEPRNPADGLTGIIDLTGDDPEIIDLVEETNTGMRRVIDLTEDAN